MISITDTAQALESVSTLDAVLSFVGVAGLAALWRAWKLRGALGIVVQGVAWFRRFALGRLDLSRLGLTADQEAAVRARVGSWAFDGLETLVQGRAIEANVEGTLAPVVKKETKSLLAAVDENGNPKEAP